MASPDGGVKQKQGRRRDAELRTAATSLFHDRGYEGTSVEDIASALGILKGSLYYYISSKEDLLFGIVSEVHDDVQRIVAESLSRTELAPLERVALYVRKQALYNLSNVTRITVYYREMDQLGADRRDAIRAQRRRQHQAITEVLEQAQSAGEVDGSVNIHLASHSVFATVNWIYTWWRPDGASGQLKEEVAESCVDFVLCGVPGFGGRRDTAPLGVAAH
jgi:AcrR family transcriptional regulator